MSITDTIEDSSRLKNGTDAMVAQWRQEADEYLRRVDRLEALIFQRTRFLQQGVPVEAVC